MARLAQLTHLTEWWSDFEKFLKKTQNLFSAIFKKVDLHASCMGSQHQASEVYHHHRLPTA
jgi:hypothetical protein